MGRLLNVEKQNCSNSPVVIACRKALVGVGIMKKLRESNTFWAAVSVLVSCGIICCFWKLYYAVVDDVFYRNVITGKYTGSIRPQGMMIKYPVTLMISLASRLFFHIDIYGIFWVLSHFLCFFLITKCVLHRFPSNRISALCMISIVFWVVDVPNIIYFQFTTTAALYAATGVFLLLLGEQKIRIYIVSLIMFTMSICIRKDTFIMVLPFIMLVWLLRLWESYKSESNIGREVKKCLLYLCILGVLYGGISVVDYLAGDKDAVHDEFRIHRTNVRDYDGVPDYDTYPQFYQELGEDGLARTEYDLIRRQMVVWDYSADIHDIFKYMHGLNLENRKRLEPKYKLIMAKTKFLTVWERVLVKPQIVIAGLTWIIIGICLLIKRKWVYLLFAITGGFGIIGEAFVLLYRGRMPERVMQSLMLTIVLFLFGMVVRLLLRDKSNEDIGRKDRICFYVLGVAYVAVFFMLLLPGIQEKQAEYEKRYRKYTIIDEYCAEHPENIYFITGDTGDTDRLGSKYDNSFVNYISPKLNLGPSYYELLETAGIKGSAEEAVTTQANTYIIGIEENADIIALDEYFAEKYKDAYSCEIVDQLEDSFCVWKICVR